MIFLLNGVEAIQMKAMLIHLFLYQMIHTKKWDFLILNLL